MSDLLYLKNWRYLDGSIPEEFWQRLSGFDNQLVSSLSVVGENVYFWIWPSPVRLIMGVSW